MIALIYDTETTGIPQSKLPVDDPQQARIMQIAMLLVEDGNQIASFYSRIFPDGWGVPHPKAVEAHGLTVASCEKLGIEMAKVLEVFNQFLDVADVVVCHNYRFDSQLIEIERAYHEILAPVHKPSYCTMEALTPIMGLKRTNGAAKWPNLTEALEFAAPGTVLANAHDAMADVIATSKVFKWLVDNKHFAGA